MELVVCHGSHAAFVLFMRTVNIEVAKSGDRSRKTLLHFFTQNLIEQIFGVAVHVQGFFVTDVFFKDIGCAVGCGGGSIDEGDLFFLAPAEKLERIAVVVFHHVVAVVLHGVGAGAFVENGFGLCDLAGFNFFNEVDLIEIINDVMVGKYQAYTQADLTELRKAGCEVKFKSVQEGTRLYMLELLKKFA